MAANDIVDGQTTLALQNPVLLENVAYAMGTLLLIVAVQRVFRGFLGTVAVLLGLVIGTLVAWGLGDAHFDDVAGSGWVGYTLPFYFGIPTFSFTAILSMIVVMLITAVETTGDVYATGEIVGKRIRRADIAAALRADGLATTIGGVLNSFPYTCFAENVGLVRLTQVKSRWVVASAGVIMIILGRSRRRPRSSRASRTRCSAARRSPCSPPWRWSASRPWARSTSTTTATSSSSGRAWGSRCW